MNTEITDNINKFGKASYDASKELYEINLKIAQQIYDQQLAFYNLSIDYATATLELVSNSKDYNDIVSGQTALFNDTSEKVQGIARNTVDIMNESKEEVGAWVEKGVEDVASVVPFVQKSA